MIKDYIVLLLVASFCVCHQYDDDDYTENKVDSRSREVFNTSSRKRPGRFMERLNDAEDRVRTSKLSRRTDLEPEDLEPPDLEPKDLDPKDQEPKDLEPEDLEAPDLEPKDLEPKDLEPKDLEPNDLELKDLEPKDLEPKDLEPTDLEPKDLEPRHLEPKDQEPKDTEPKDLEITGFPWTTESKIEEPTWSIEATEKPSWKIHSIEPDLNEGAQLIEEWPKPEWTNEPSPPDPTEEIIEFTEEPVEFTEKPVEVSEDILELTQEPLEFTEQPQEVTEEPLEVTEEPVEVTEEPVEVTEPSLEVTEETTAFNPFNDERLKSVDDRKEEYKITKVANSNEERHTQVPRADEEHKAHRVNYPFAVSIQRKGAHYASGALVDKKWILSSAGEFYNVRESKKIYRARLGSVDCKRGGQVVPLRSIELHPSFVPGKPNYDIAMIRMAKLVDFTDNIHPIGLTKVQDKVLSAKFLSTYWPRVVIKGQVLPSTAKEREKYNSMRVSTQRLIPWDKCYERLTQQMESLAESSLCLRPVLAHHSTCMPDVGAPVVAHDGLWGITSGWTSQDCATARRPSPVVVARVSSPSVRSWLDSLLLAPEN